MIAGAAILSSLELFVHRFVCPFAILACHLIVLRERQRCPLGLWLVAILCLVVQILPLIQGS